MIRRRFRHFIIIVVSVLLLEGEGTKPLAMTENGGRLPSSGRAMPDSPVIIHNDWFPAGRH